MLILLLLLTQDVQAADEAIVGPVSAGQTVRATTKAWLLPDGHYNACLAHALDVQSLGQQLALCVEKGQDALEDNALALGRCRETLGNALVQLDEDTALASTLTDRIMQLDQQAAKYKRQRNTAIGMLGGIALTTAAVAVVRRTR